MLLLLIILLIFLILFLLFYFILFLLFHFVLFLLFYFILFYFIFVIVIDLRWMETSHWCNEDGGLLARVVRIRGSPFVNRRIFRISGLALPRVCSVGSVTSSRKFSSFGGEPVVERTGQDPRERERERERESDACFFPPFLFSSRSRSVSEIG